MLVGVDVALDNQMDIAHEPQDASATMKNDRWIVLTTIQGPTEAVRAISRIPGWSMVVVGDEKTPQSWT